MEVEEVLAAAARGLIRAAVADGQPQQSGGVDVDVTRVVHRARAVDRDHEALPVEGRSRAGHRDLVHREVPGPLDQAQEQAVATEVEGEIEETGLVLVGDALAEVGQLLGGAAPDRHAQQLALEAGHVQVVGARSLHCAGGMVDTHDRGEADGDRVERGLVGADGRSRERGRGGGLLSGGGRFAALRRGRCRGPTVISVGDADDHRRGNHHHHDQPNPSRALAPNPSPLLHAGRDATAGFATHRYVARVAQNRVAATGEIVASPLRCRWMGNRGVLHRGRGASARVVRGWANRRWILCETDFRGWRAQQWEEGRYTVLFFHDEAVGLAAGHRPCALCRHVAYRDFGDAWSAAHDVPRPSADELDRQLHADRLDGRRPRTHERPWPDLPDGVFVLDADAPALVVGDQVVPWDPAVGYAGPARARPTRGSVTVLTPRGTVAAIAAGYVPQIDDAARG